MIDKLQGWIATRIFPLEQDIDFLQSRIFPQKTNSIFTVRLFLLVLYDLPEILLQFPHDGQDWTGNISTIFTGCELSQ